MNHFRNALESLADIFDRIRDPGWLRTLVLLGLLVVVLLIPYPLSVTGKFEMISTNPVMTRNKAEGIVLEVLVATNDEVEEGQVVARLSDVEIGHELATIDAELAAASALLRMKQSGYRKEDVEIERFRVQELRAIERLAKVEYTRMRKLLASGGVSQAELDLAQSKHLQAKKIVSRGRQELMRLENGFRSEEIEQAVASVDRLLAHRNEALQRRDWMEIRSPKKGRVVTSNEELRQLVGQHVERGTALFATIAGGELVAKISIDENDFGDVELEDEVLLRPYQFPSTKFRGRVDSILPVVASDDEFITTVSVISRADNTDWSRLSLNATGKAKIYIGSRPVGAVLYRRVLRSLWVQAWSWY